MRFVSLWWWVASVALLTGCQSLQSQETGHESTATERASERVQLEAAWKNFEIGDFDKALAGFQSFLKQQPHSIFEVEARFGEARSRASLGDWTTAMSGYREVVLQRLGSHPELATLAMYYESEAAEALGSDVQALAILQDAERNARLLPVEIRLAALPARLATINYKVGQTEEARRYTAQAQRGLETLGAQGITARKKAELSLMMGSVATNDLAPENFQPHLDSFANAQIFLLGAIESGEAPLNGLALQTLQSHYRDLWNMAMSPPSTQGLEAGTRERMKAELQNRWLGQISRLSAILRQNQRADMSKATPEEVKLSDFLKSLDVELRSRLMSTDTMLPLTPEALSRQKLKRSGTVHSEISRPVTPAIHPSDPNLQSGESK